MSEFCNLFPCVAEQFVRFPTV